VFEWLLLESIEFGFDSRETLVDVDGDRPTLIRRSEKCFQLFHPPIELILAPFHQIKPDDHLIKAFVDLVEALVETLFETVDSSIDCADVSSQGLDFRRDYVFDCLLDRPVHT
jgi:hypothetical protein